MTKLIFVRHGEAEGNIIRNFHGFYNSELTENGLEQIKRAAARLESEHIDAIYSSDLKRAFKTAQEIAKGRDIEIKTDERFREIHGGKWEDVPWDDLPVLFAESYDIWLNDVGNATPDGGESVAALLDRIVTAVTRIAKENKGKTVVIACHGTPIRVLQCYCEGKTLDEMAQVPWAPNASISTVLYEDGKLTMPTAGFDKHLGTLASSLPSNV
jgi:probable phosphoglycerate mutase